VFAFTQRCAERTVTIVRYIIQRILQLAPVLFVVGTIIFFMFRVIPGDPAQAILGLNTTPRALASLRHEMGLDRPLSVQYIEWFGRVGRGDLGISRLEGQIPVGEILWNKTLHTLELVVTGVALALAAAVPLGVAAATAGGWTDQVIRVFAMLGFSTPSYWLAILLMLLFAAKLGWLPAGGFVPFVEKPLLHLRYLVLPAFTVAFIEAAAIVRFLRAGMLEVLNLNYIQTARAKGLPRGVVIYKHALKNSMIPVITVLGMDVGGLVGGLVVTEQIFVWPGLGWQMVTSIGQRDYEVVQGAVLFSALLFVAINLAVDVLYAFLDPRIRYD
jgi:peptide/nickel transport system permease protein